MIVLDASILIAYLNGSAAQDNDATVASFDVGLLSAARKLGLKTAG